MLPKNGSNPIFDLCFTKHFLSFFLFLPTNKYQNQQNNNSHFHSSSSMVMGQQKNQNFKDLHHQRWDVMEESDKHKHYHEQEHPCSSISTISNGSSSLTCSSSSSSDTTDDDASSSSANSSRSSLYDLSDLMSQLPIKRGLSKFYHGKSDSFTSLARVTSIEDLPKKEQHKMKKKKKKNYRSHTLPKPIISKKISRKKKFGGSIRKKNNQQLDE